MIHLSPGKGHCGVTPIINILDCHMSSNFWTLEMVLPTWCLTWNTNSVVWIDLITVTVWSMATRKVIDIKIADFKVESIFHVWH